MELMALCLTVFPPSPDFEDYLEAFVRQVLVYDNFIISYLTV
jgi:hypothetical protein